MGLAGVLPVSALRVRPPRRFRWLQPFEFDSTLKSLDIQDGATLRFRSVPTDSLRAFIEFVVESSHRASGGPVPHSVEASRVHRKELPIVLHLGRYAKNGRQADFKRIFSMLVRGDVTGG